MVTRSPRGVVFVTIVVTAFVAAMIAALVARLSCEDGAVLVFVPVAFVEQEAGQLYSDVAIAISAAILASMVVAVTLLPTAAARLDFAADDNAGRARPGSGRGRLRRYASRPCPRRRGSRGRW